MEYFTFYAYISIIFDCFLISSKNICVFFVIKNVIKEYVKTVKIKWISSVKDLVEPEI